MSRIEGILRSLGIDPEKFFRRGDRGTTTMDNTKGPPKTRLPGGGTKYTPITYDEGKNKRQNK